MSGPNFQRDNHFVPQAYLKRFESSNKRVWTYRTLVSHVNVPHWKEASIRGIGYHAHLYTRVIARGETDEIEKWLNDEFESPAAEAMDKATSDGRLTPDDWKRLVYLLAAQDVRTPARLIENLQRWNDRNPRLMQETLRERRADEDPAQRANDSLDA